MENASFYTQQGRELRGVTAQQHAALLLALRDELGITPLQTAEAAAYSFAMVVRYALGLSATGGQVSALVNDSLAGWIVLATVRHLRNAGADVRVLFLMDPEQHGDEIARLLKPLESQQVDLDHWSLWADDARLEELCATSHNILVGLMSPVDEGQQRFVSAFNEAQTPVHVVHCPLGIDPDSGQASADPLFASSTLSLGCPLNGLQRGKDFVGRHYVCDISLTSALYQRAGCGEVGWLFSEQPVVQLHATPPKSPTP